MQISLTGSARVLALLPLLLLGACAGSSSHMRDVPTAKASYDTRSDQALVVFLRPSTFGFAIESSVYEIVDGDPVFIGIVSAKTKLAHYTSPGERRFMVISESADFMDATLDAGKAYYTLVRVRPGAWKARFSLNPIRAADLQEDRFADWYEATRWVEKQASASEWASANAASIREKMDDNLPRWLEKTDKPILLVRDGLETPYQAAE